MNEVFKPFYVADVSGGKDSFYMLKIIAENHLPLDCIMTVDLEIEHPVETLMKNEYQKFCDKLGIPFIRLKPDTTYQELYDMHKGNLPRKGNMWCQKEYKQQALRKYDNYLLDKGYSIYHYIGYALNEKSRFEIAKKYVRKGTFIIAPLIDYGITEEFILSQLNPNDFLGWYQNHKRLGCTMCPYRKNHEIKWCLEHNLPVYTLSNGINHNYLGTGKEI